MEGKREGEDKVGERKWRVGFGPPKNFGVEPPMVLMLLPGDAAWPSATFVYHAVYCVKRQMIDIDKSPAVLPPVHL